MTDQSQKIATLLSTVTLGHGVGTKARPCTMAAINLAIDGRLTDKIPECVSPVIGRWVISIQDAMPLDRLNGARWRALVPAIAGTGREHDGERVAIIMDWMWGIALPQLQPVADACGFGAEWRTMCADRTAAAAFDAADAAALEAAAEAAVLAPRVAARAAAAAEAASWVAFEASAEAAAEVAAEVAARVAAVVEAAVWAPRVAEAGMTAEYWTAIDPERLLEQLIMVGIASPVRSAE